MTPFRMFGSLVARSLVAVGLGVPAGFVVPAGAQQAPVSVTGMGSVTGRVVCADTQRPARFAGVVLLGVPKTTAPTPDPKATPDAAQMKAAMNAALGGMNFTQTQTALDGTYAIANVAPGDYYVFASVPGYVQPASLAQAALDAGADLTKGIPGVNIVHIAADRTLNSDVTVPRGAALSGSVLWDDGTPVARVIVTVEAAAKDGTAPAKTKLPPEFAMLGVAAGIGGGGVLSIVDDLGHYRIAGLAPGNYNVKATLQVKQQFAMQGGVMNLSGMAAEKPLIFYATGPTAAVPATLHKAQAKPITLKGGDELNQQVIAINLSNMHAVSGRIASAEDHHGINSGTVTLTDASDKDFVRTGSLDANGNYTVAFVPPGTYNLEADAEDTTPSKKRPTGLIRMTSDETLRSYADGKSSVIVLDADVAGQNLELTPEKTAKKDVDLEQLFKP